MRHYGVEIQIEDALPHVLKAEGYKSSILSEDLLLFCVIKQ